MRLYSVPRPLAIGMASGALALAMFTQLAPVPAAESVPTSPRPVSDTALERCGPDLSALRRRSDQPGPAGARAGYLLAHCLERAGRTGEAWAMFDAVAGRYPPLASYARFRAALITLKSGAAGEAAARLAGLLTQGLSVPLARRARMAYAEALIKAGQPAQAAKVLRGILQSASDEETLARTWWLLGTAAESLADRAQARQAYAMAWWAFPDSALAPDAARRLRELSGGPLPEPPPEARMERAARLLNLGEQAAAERDLVLAIRAGLPPAIAAEAWYRLGLLRLRSGAAMYAFEQAARDPEQAARALYWLGRVLASTGRSGQARSVWHRVEQQYPGSVWAARSLLALASRAEGAGARRTADAILTEVVRRFPGSHFAEEAHWRRGWLKYRLGRFAQAEAIWLRATQTLPASSRAAANLYWAAKAREQQGRSARSLLEQIARRYPLTYYGQRARSRLRWPAPARISPPGDGSLPDDRFSSTHEELGALGLDREAADEAEALLPSRAGPQTLRFIAVHRRRAGEIPASVAAAAAAVSPALYGGSTADVELWALAYPRAYWDQVRAAAAAAGIDPYLVLAVVREESRFDARVVSPAGAIGLMQLLPGTARALAGGAEITPRALMDPELSLRYGSAYLGRVLQRFGGDVVLALAAYNAGPAAARRFARQRRTDPDLFIERIPFPETRAYIQRVLESYGIYRWLYR